MAVFRLTLGFALIALIACTNAKPQFSALEGIPQPLFFGKTNHSINVVDPNLDIAISGSCDARVSSLSFQIQGYQNWADASNFASGAVIEDCKGGGTFSFNLKSLNSMGVWNLAQTVRFTLEAKSTYSVGDSAISQLQVEYVLPVNVKPGQFHLGQGAGLSSSTNFRVRAGVSAISGQKASSPSFSVQRR